MIRLERTSVLKSGKCYAGSQESYEQLATDGQWIWWKWRLLSRPQDLDLAMRLRKAGSDHRKFIRQIFVSVDITAPIYWWKEYDTYKVATVANSTSTMHKIHSRPFELDDFSHDHLTKGSCNYGKHNSRIRGDPAAVCNRKKKRGLVWPNSIAAFQL